MLETLKISRPQQAPPLFKCILQKQKMVWVEKIKRPGETEELNFYKIVLTPNHSGVESKQTSYPMGHVTSELSSKHYGFVMFCPNIGDTTHPFPANQLVDAMTCRKMR